MDYRNDLIAKDLTRKYKEAAWREFILNNQERWMDEGEEICSRRQALGFTAAAFAREVNLDPRRLRKLEWGEPVRDGDILRRLCVAELSYHEMRSAYQQAAKENEILRQHMKAKLPAIATKRIGRSVI